MWKLFVLCFTLSLTGCCGTLITRGVSNHDVFGAVPYTAVAQDVVACGYVSDGFEGGMCAVVAFVSIPLDLTLDTLFLPVDLFAWLCGYEKQGVWDFGKVFLDRDPS